MRVDQGFVPCHVVPKNPKYVRGLFHAVPMGQRIFRMATICLAFTVVSVPTVATAAFDELETPAPSCASVYKAPTDSQEASFGLALPGDPKDSLFVRAELVAPDTENSNGTHLSVYASPLLCV